MTPHVNYDFIASTYDRRYENHLYDGLERELIRFVGSAPASVLEVGCGTGHWLKVLSDNGHLVVGLDPSKEMLKRAANRVPYIPLICASADSLPINLGNFDRIVCINSFHHFQHKRRFIHAASKILGRSGGLMIYGLDPHTGIDRSWFYDYFPSALRTDLARYPSGETIREWMSEAGFESLETRLAQHFDESFSAPVALEHGRLDKTQSSQLALLSDEEYEAGIARLREDIEAATRKGEDFVIANDLRGYVVTGRMNRR